MSTRNIVNAVASIKARLMNSAREHETTFNALLVRYANERFLYRLSISPFRDHLILKGGNLFLIWQNGLPYRPTIDTDFLVLGQSDPEYLKTLFFNVCNSIIPEPDGLSFDATSIQGTQIREEAQYGGMKITLFAFLGPVRIHLQFDIGIGDAITPAPELSKYPVILDFPAPILYTYPKETAIAEKTKTMTSLGMVNSRMKDFADILILQRNFSFNFSLLQTAIQRKYKRNDIPIPTSLPICFSEDFAHSPTKQVQWTAFRKKASLSELPVHFEQIVFECKEFLLPLLLSPSSLPTEWKPNLGWIFPQRTSNR